MMRSLAAAALLVSVALPSAHAQNGQVQQAGIPAHRSELLFELSGGVGYTSVDLEKWGGSGSTNEELLLSQFDARLFFARAGGFQLGLEGGYRYFFYYEVPFGTNMLTRDVAATRIGGVARRELNGVVSLDLGTAVYMFDGFTDFGVSGAMVFRIPAGKVGIPLHLRTDLVFDEQLMIGSGMTLGIALKR
jgi:hypothetical protein